MIINAEIYVEVNCPACDSKWLDYLYQYASSDWFRVRCNGCGVHSKVKIKPGTMQIIKPDLGLGVVGGAE